MSRLARALTLAAMLAAMTLAGLTAAHAQLTAGDDQRAWQDQTTSDAATRTALAQERYYSTWRIGDTTAPAPAEPGGQLGWVVPAIGVLAAGLTLLGVLATAIVWRTRGRIRARQAA